MLRHQIIRTRRANDIRVLLIGPHESTASPVVFLHPINMRKECWLEQVVELSRERQCVLFDLAGHGESSDDQEFSLRHWVSDCYDVVLALELDRFHVVGGSLGGTIALCLASELPREVASVTAMGSSLGDPQRAPGPRVADADAGEAPTFASIDEMFAALAVEAVAPTASETVIETVRLLTNTHGQQVVQAVLHAAETADASPWVDGVVCPVLVITGEHDSTCPSATGEAMALSVTGRHLCLQGVGHLPMIESPGIVLAEVAAHLREADAQATTR